jgi:hypothetical protein
MLFLMWIGRRQQLHTDGIVASTKGTYMSSSMTHLWHIYTVIVHQVMCIMFTYHCKYKHRYKFWCANIPLFDNKTLMINHLYFAQLITNVTIIMVKLVLGTRTTELSTTKSIKTYFELGLNVIKVLLSNKGMFAHQNLYLCLYLQW